ncbi:hypothetical protein [Candidatus Methylocalor cossyra]|uniref:Uncharacterized protein n=1 Tax=Candidatus Methylocalor cossyra TaxID=3108543 RepID=A0ABM9NM96_9GAMM
MQSKQLPVSAQPDSTPTPKFPSARYFQVHFEHLQQTLQAIGDRLETLQRELAELRRQRELPTSEQETD